MEIYFIFCVKCIKYTDRFYRGRTTIIVNNILTFLIICATIRMSGELFASVQILHLDDFYFDIKEIVVRFRSKITDNDRQYLWKTHRIKVENYVKMC